jgi:pimeloyl-ACP methyl ester carboxylesterase
MVQCPTRLFDQMEGDHMDEAPGGGGRPTLVLVHGGSTTSVAWDPVLPHLRTPALAVDLPGRRYRPADLATVRRADWERAVADEVTALGPGPGGVVLVGHSSGAYVVPGAAALLPPGTVRHLVLVAATCPREGDRPVDALAPKLQAMTLGNEPHLRARAAGRTLGGLRDGEPPIETALEVVEIDPRQGLEAPLQLFEPMTWAGVPPVGRTYVRALRDRVIPPDHALVMAANAEAGEVVDLDAAHDVAGSAPAELAAVLDRVAAGVPGGAVRPRPEP